MNEPWIVVVDPYSSGSLLPAEFRKHGYRCVGVRSTPEVPTLYRRSFDPAAFDEVLPYIAGHEELAATLRHRDVRYVLPGCELGVDLAQCLSETLGLPSNQAGLRDARRDKYVMNEAVAAQSLRTAPQITSHQPSDVLAWANRRGNWPIVVKPRMSTASDSVHLCHSAANAVHAFECIMNTRNVLGLDNGAVLAQEFLDGTEYIIDTVSCQGQHRVAALWRGERSSLSEGEIGYDSIVLLPAEGPLQTELVAFAFAALDALGIEHGPAHTELMWRDDGVAFVETGARLNGGKIPVITRACCGAGQVELTVESIVDPEGFQSRRRQRYQLSRHGALAFLVPPVKGKLTDVPRLADIRALPSHSESHIRPRPHEPVPRIVGWVSLIHDDPAVVARDLARIRQLEVDGLYDIQPLDSR
ncbi:MAG: ATP-grasp domain-containing protein [Gammaproteobacteria bacterium]|nr:ATP-grasp domain-containing protein [Gammaproteobacteria bacterium]